LASRQTCWLHDSLLSLWSTEAPTRGLRPTKNREKKRTTFSVTGTMSAMRMRNVTAVLLGAVVLLSACNNDDRGREPDLGDEGSAEGENPQEDDDAVPPTWPFDEPSGDTRLVRLTHAQYENTIAALFGVEDPLEIEFPPDALNGFEFDTSIDFRVDGRLGPLYRAAAEQLGERAVSDPEVFDNIVPCDPAEAACVLEFIASFGERAFRRPLTADQTDRFVALFGQGTTLIASGDAFRDGVQLTLRAMLQSPQFVYRTEMAGDAGPDGRIALDDWEIASRLSYFLFDSMPDDDLFALAREGELHTPEQLAPVVDRLVADPRALPKLVSFHAQTWRFDRYSRITLDPATFPSLPADIVPRIRDASERFVAEVIESGGGLDAFLTAPYAFADESVAELYGLSAPPGAPSRIDLTSTGRKGLLMQVGFLASNAYALKTDPIHRGLFVVRDLLCRTIPDPPPGASMTPLPETDDPIETTREEISLLTGGLACVACHQQINPPGFAFEGFGAAGEVRLTENEIPVDTRGELRLDGETVSFAGPGELVDALATSQDARNCYAGKWLEFALGRRLTSTDEEMWLQLGQKSSGVPELVRATLASPGFTSLAAGEAGQ